MNLMMIHDILFLTEVHASCRLNIEGNPDYLITVASSRSTHHLLASLLRTGTQEASLIGMRTVSFHTNSQIGIPC